MLQVKVHIVYNTMFASKSLCIIHVYHRMNSVTMDEYSILIFFMTKHSISLFLVTMDDYSILIWFMTKHSIPFLLVELLYRCPVSCWSQLLSRDDLRMKQASKITTHWYNSCWKASPFSDLNLEVPGKVSCPDLCCQADLWGQILS